MKETRGKSGLISLFIIHFSLFHSQITPYHWLIIPFAHLYSESHYHTQIDSFSLLLFFDSLQR